MNYLPDAVRHGARIFTEIDVSTVTPRGTRWRVRAQPLGTRRARHGRPLAVEADIVVLAAGSLGSTAILLRSGAQGLRLSERVGHRFTGNGDVLGFAVRAEADVNAVGAGPRAPDPARPPGPCITVGTTITGAAAAGTGTDRRGRAGGPGDDILVEDAVIPGALAPLVPGALAPQALPRWLLRRWRPGSLTSLLVSWLTRGRRGLLEHTETFLLMGSDDDEGRIVLEDDRPTVAWPGAGTSRFYERANAVLATLAQRAGGTYLHSPIWTRRLRHRLLTVHPLGGCVIAERAEDGVVDHRGAVFAGPSGDAVHRGLYVWDGSIVPRPVGVNPLLTISALAERAAEILVSEERWVWDDSLPATDPPAGDTPAPA
jgi:cholesterol oxidase